MKKLLTIITFCMTLAIAVPCFAVQGPYWMQGHGPNRATEILDQERTWRHHNEEIVLEDYYNRLDNYFDYLYDDDSYTYEYSYVYDQTTDLYHLLLKTIKNGSEESLKEFQLDNEDMNVFIRLVKLSPNQKYILENYDDPLYLQRYKRIINSIFINYHIVDEDTYSMEIYIE